ncbi:hypothetical protein LP419_32545 [Massilia sp. H-1]|nr:hypothetical protein LP419_32545 [Massilia sp. H-1]
MVLPFIALLAEVATGILEHSLFNPIPTPFHALLIGTVPLANLMLLGAVGRSLPLGKPWAWLHAFSTGISLIYAILFLLKRCRSASSCSFCSDWDSCCWHRRSRCWPR